MEKISKEYRDMAVEQDLKLSTMQAEMDSGVYMEKHLKKVKGFLDSPYLGDSMRAHLTQSISDKKALKDKFQAKMTEAKERNDIELEKEIEEKING